MPADRPVLADSALTMLRPVYDAYMAAETGQLGRTADALRDACKALGWRWDCGMGYLPWARYALGVLT